MELKKCADCDYCYQLAISTTYDIPIIPDYHKKNRKRRSWIKKYGKNHYQMYVALSKLGKYAIIYWSRYTYFLFLFEKIERKKIAPNDEWGNTYKCVVTALKKNGIKLIQPSICQSTYKLKYEGRISGVDNQPTLEKLLFSEELH